MAPNLPRVASMVCAKVHDVELGLGCIGHTAQLRHPEVAVLLEPQLDPGHLPPDALDNGAQGGPGLVDGAGQDHIGPRDVCPELAQDGVDAVHPRVDADHPGPQCRDVSCPNHCHRT